MIESKRADKKKNQAKVVKELIKDPSLTERELAQKAGIGNGTAHRHKEQLEQTGAKSNILDRILQMDDEIMDLANQITLREIKRKIEDGKELSLNDTKIIGDLANNSTKRKAIFGSKEGKVNDNITIQI